jgi:FkbM family methyltransferase
MNDTLYLKCKEINLDIKNVCEVGVFLPHTSNILGFINDGCSAMLVEPDPVCITAINEYFKDKKNVRLMPYAVFDPPGNIELYRTNASTFVSTLNSTPALVNDKYKPKDKDKFNAISKRFNEIDEGNLDLISIDVEGAEWFVIKDIISKPKVISTEIRAKKYINPFYDKIKDWMESNGYVVWYEFDSDVVFILKEHFKPVFIEIKQPTIVDKFKKTFGIK